MSGPGEASFRCEVEVPGSVTTVEGTRDRA